MKRGMKRGMRRAIEVRLDYWSAKKEKSSRNWLHARVQASNRKVQIEYWHGTRSHRRARKKSPVETGCMHQEFEHAIGKSRKSTGMAREATEE